MEKNDKVDYTGFYRSLQIRKEENFSKYELEIRGFSGWSSELSRHFSWCGYLGKSLETIPHTLATSSEKFFKFLEENPIAIEAYCLGLAYRELKYLEYINNFLDNPLSEESEPSNKKLDFWKQEIRQVSKTMEDLRARFKRKETREEALNKKSDDSFF